MSKGDVEDSLKYTWKPRRFNYVSDANHRRLKSATVTSSQYHPLKPITVTEATAVKASQKEKPKSRLGSSSSNQSSLPQSEDSESSSDFVDPLSALSMTDPLSASVQPAKTSKKQTSSKAPVKSDVIDDVSDEDDDDFEPWEARDFVKATVAARQIREMPKRYKPGVSVSEKLKDRLGELDDFEEGGFLEMQNLTQQEFIHRIDMLKRTLTTSWNENQKVKALKIAIQCAKLLGSVSVLAFYPSKFVLVTELLSVFGELVHRRISSFCADLKPEQVNAKNLPENAREICLNWLLKIASIRELLPRLYIEAATLHCNEFIKQGESRTVLVRLTNMARGVGDPLVAVYVRAYLCRVGRLYIPEFKGHLKSNLYDFISTYKQIHTAPVQNVLAAQKLDMASYLRHFTPALEWILSCLAHKAREATLAEVMEKCEKSISSLLLFNCCIASFNAEFVASRAHAFASIINQSQDNLFSKYLVYRSLGTKVVKVRPPEESRLILLNDVWKVLTKLKNPEYYQSTKLFTSKVGPNILLATGDLFSHYIACVEVWVEYVAMNFTRKEINTVLNDIIKHMIPDRAFESFYPQLISIMVKILEHTTSFSDLFSVEKFLPFVDLFQKEEKKVEICKAITDAFCKKNVDSTTSDAIAISGLMYICKAMHDPINALSLDDDRKSVSALISSAILKITFGKDFEQQLSFYVECRATFHGLDAVIACLVHAVNNLSAKVSAIVKGNHTRKTAAFVRACTAYAFITIPSLSNVQTRMALYLESGQVALISQCITQADAMYKSAISMFYDLATIPDAKKGGSSQQQFTSFVSNFLSSLLTVPDNTEQGVLILLRGLLNVISQATDVISPDAKCNIYIKVLSLLTAYSQDRYIYRVEKVDSNETMYSSDSKFLAEIASMSTTVLDEILGFLAPSKTRNGSRDQSVCAYHLFETVLAHADISDPDMQDLAITAWNVAIRHNTGQTKNMARMLQYLKSKGGDLNQLAVALAIQTTT